MSSSVINNIQSLITQLQKDISLLLSSKITLKSAKRTLSSRDLVKKSNASRAIKTKAIESKRIFNYVALIESLICSLHNDLEPIDIDTKQCDLIAEIEAIEAIEAMHTKAHTQQQQSNETHAYIRVSTKSQLYDSQESDIKKAYPCAKITKETLSGVIRASKRDGLSRLIDKLRKGDLLIVWWIDRLGRDYHDTESTIRTLLEKGVIIKTINQSMTFMYTNDDLQDMTTNIQLTMVAAMAAAERCSRLASAEAGRRALRENPVAWSDKFKGRKADDVRCARILELSKTGLSVRRIAKELNCNVSTVQRAITKNKNR